MTDWDHIIVGAGSAGCVLAHCLSEDRQKRVLLIEAGGSDRNPLQRIPANGYLLNLGNPKTDWLFKTQPDASREGRTEIWSRGKMMGGSSSINGMIYIRGAPSDYDRWAELGNRGWAYQDVLPSFKWLETNEYCNEENPLRHYYGGAGLLKVQSLKRPHTLSHAFVSACGDAGISPNPDHNARDQAGASMLTYTQSNRVRCSASQAFIEPARRRPNLQILKNTLISKVLLENRKAVGVLAQKDGRHPQMEFRAREVVLSAGAINSPQLLMLSGIGPADHLREMGIPVVIDLPGVGRNLQDHPCFNFLAKAKTATVVNAFTRISAGFEWLLYGAGPLMAGYQAVAFVKTEPHLTEPDVQIHMAPVGTYKSKEGAYQYSTEPCVTLLPNVSHPRSRGTIRLNSDSPFAHPAIHPNLLGNESDIAVLIGAGRLCRRIMQTKSLCALIESEVLPGRGVNTDQEWSDFFRATVTTSYHHAGTCKMGTDPMAVVDPMLKVHGLDGLRVIDGSIMPTIPSGNTNAACMMIGKKGAEIMLRASGS